MDVIGLLSHDKSSHVHIIHASLYMQIHNHVQLNGLRVFFKPALTYMHEVSVDTLTERENVII